MNDWTELTPTEIRQGVVILPSNFRSLSQKHQETLISHNINSRSQLEEIPAQDVYESLGHNLFQALRDVFFTEDWPSLEQVAATSQFDNHLHINIALDASLPASKVVDALKQAGIAHMDHLAYSRSEVLLPLLQQVVTALLETQVVKETKLPILIEGLEVSTRKYRERRQSVKDLLPPDYLTK